MKLEYTDRALKELLKLPTKIAQRIALKMKWFVHQDDPLSFAKPLSGTLNGLYRFRVGDYRVLCVITKNEIHILSVLTIKHRKEVYGL